MWDKGEMFVCEAYCSPYKATIVERHTQKKNNLLSLFFVKEPQVETVCSQVKCLPTPLYMYWVTVVRFVACETL